MAGYIGLLTLVVIATIIVFLFWRRKKIENDVGDFYQQNGFVSDTIPPAARAMLGDKWICFRVKIRVQNKHLEFHWLEAYRASTIVTDNVPHTTQDNFLAVVLPPRSVSRDFISRVSAWMRPKNSNIDFFVLNTEKPIRAEILKDDSYLIVWRTLNRDDVMSKNLTWLKENLTLNEEENLPKEDVLVPISELFATLEGAELERAKLVMSMLSEFYRDYHDYKGNPPHRLEDFAKYNKLTPEQFAIADAALQRQRGYKPEYIAQFYSEYGGWGNWDGFDITIGGREFAFVTARDILIDLESKTVYKN